MNTKKYQCRRKNTSNSEWDEDINQQHVITSKCRWRKLACRSKEQKYDWIVWNRVPQDTSIFHSLGKLEVHQTANFIMVSELGIGGSIIRKENNLILLDNTYVLKTVNNSNPYGNISFAIFAEDYAWKTRSNIQKELLEGRISKEFMRKSQLMTTLAGMLCWVNADVHKLQLLNLHSFPDTVGKMIYAEKGVTITQRGDAYMARRCKKILWDQK